jgi:hypothetical protein
MIAPLRFGSPAIDYASEEVALTVTYYDLEAVEYKELDTEAEKRVEEIPWHLILISILILCAIGYYLRGKFKK